MKRIGLALAGLVVFGSVVSAMRNVTDFFAEPQMTELRLVRSQVAAVPALLFLGIQTLSLSECPSRNGGRTTG